MYKMAPFILERKTLDIIWNALIFLEGYSKKLGEELGFSGRDFKKQPQGTKILFLGLVCLDFFYTVRNGGCWRQIFPPRSQLMTLGFGNPCPWSVLLCHYTPSSLLSQWASTGFSQALKLNFSEIIHLLGAREGCFSPSSKTQDRTSTA